MKKDKKILTEEEKIDLNKKIDIIEKALNQAKELMKKKGWIK